MDLVLSYVVQITEHEKQWYTSWGNLPEAKMGTSVGQILLGEDSLGTSCIVCLIKEFSVIYSDLFKDVCRENNIEDIVFSPEQR